MIDNITIAELCDLAHDKKVSIEVTITKEDKKIEIFPWREYRPTCPYANDVTKED